jgi:hypothetical protein
VRFLIDENLSGYLVDLLRSRGHEPLTVVGSELAGKADPTILLGAAQHSATLITENHQDLLLLHQAWRLWSEAWPLSARREHPGILTVVQRPRNELERTADAIARIARSGRRLQNELYRWRGMGDWQHFAL